MNTLKILCKQLMLASTAGASNAILLKHLSSYSVKSSGVVFDKYFQHVSIILYELDYRTFLNNNNNYKQFFAIRHYKLYEFHKIMQFYQHVELVLKTNKNLLTST